MRVSAECAVPVLAVRPASGSLDFGEAYMGHPYEAEFELVNDSKLPAKFEIPPQVHRAAKHHRAGLRAAYLLTCR